MPLGISPLSALLGGGPNSRNHASPPESVGRCPHPCGRIYFAPASETSHIGGDHADFGHGSASATELRLPAKWNAAAVHEKATSRASAPRANLVSVDTRRRRAIIHSHQNQLALYQIAPRVGRPANRPKFLPVRTFPLRLWGPRTARKPVSQGGPAPFLAGRVGAHRHDGAPRHRQRPALALQPSQPRAPYEATALTKLRRPSRFMSFLNPSDARTGQSPLGTLPLG